MAWRPYPIERTFREWQQSAYAAAGPDQASCQSCHMEQAEAEPAYEFIIGLYESGNLSFDNLDAWLRDNTRPAA